MPSNIETRKLCYDLILAIENIYTLLQECGLNYKEYVYLKKALNIAKSCDPGGLKNILGYLKGDFRRISDHSVATSNLENQMNLAYAIALKLKSDTKIN